MREDEILQDYWANRYYGILQKGRTPTLDEFDTDFVDDAIDLWEQEDGEQEEISKLKLDSGEWDEVSLND